MGSTTTMPPLPGSLGSVGTAGSSPSVTGSSAGFSGSTGLAGFTGTLAALLASLGLTAAHVVKTTVFLTDLSAFPEVNEVYGALFSENPPARSCVEVSRLPKDALVEIECIVSVE